MALNWFVGVFKSGAEVSEPKRKHMEQAVCESSWLHG
jgi:hypothetical protein